MTRSIVNARLARDIRIVELSNIIDKIPIALIKNAAMFEEVNNLCPDESLLNATCAEYHKITVEQLIASPNMSMLMAQWFRHMKKISCEIFVKNGMTVEQADALFEYGILVNQE